MYDSRTIKPTLPGRHGHMTVHAYRGKGRWISDDTPRRITENVLSYTDADAIAEGLADMVDETFTFGLFEEVEAQVYEEDPYDLYERFQADLQNAEYDMAEHWDDDDWFDPYFVDPEPEPEPLLYDCDGPGMCHICTPGLDSYLD